MAVPRTPDGVLQPPPRPWWLSSGFGLVVTFIVVLWAVEALDTVLLSDRLEGGGIHPRRLDGIDGILWSPFLHRGFGHLLSNTIPVAVLGGLVAVAGLRRWLQVTVIVVVAGGAFTWLLGRSGNHVGASLLTFGWLGYLVAAAFIERNLRSMGTALVAVVLYWTMIFGLVPRAGVSWEGHLFGAVAGAGAAWLSSRDDPEPSTSFP
ncbi:MAG: rhomboid family intramembrane serine protease [Actinomycetia bacterium]|nr:rhomboid family intramembrane serine protease [Actinomycetes bacterium]